MTPAEMEELREQIVTMMASLTGPTSDAIRSQMAAQTDALIDARKRLIEAGWPEWMILEVCHSMLTGRPPQRVAK